MEYTERTNNKIELTMFLRVKQRVERVKHTRGVLNHRIHTREIL